MPRSACERITPELPARPISEPWLKLVATASRSGWRPSASASASSRTTASTVRAILVPVSPSGTGYTFSLLRVGPMGRQGVAVGPHNAAQGQLAERLPAGPIPYEHCWYRCDIEREARPRRAGWRRPVHPEGLLSCQGLWLGL